MHILIVGARGVGKSTLIRRILGELNCSVSGFETKKEPLPGGPVYISEAGKMHERSEENLVGYCVNQKPTVFSEAFDRFAEKLAAPAADVIVMDEIGFMESEAKTFCDAIMRLLDGCVPVIAAVKDKDTAFLNAVRSHRNAKCFYITPENRDALFSQVSELIKSGGLYRFPLKRFRDEGATRTV